VRQRSPPRPIRSHARLVAPLVALAFTACQQQAPPPPKVPPPSNVLSAIVRPAPGTWFLGMHDTPEGFEHDLIARFAHDSKLDLAAVTADSAAGLLSAVAHGDAMVGLGGLYRPAPGDTRPKRSATAEPDRDVLWTTGITDVEPVIVYNADGFKPHDWSDLEGASVAYIPDTGLDRGFADIRAAHPGVHWVERDAPSADTLIADVDDAKADYAIVSSADAALARNVYLGFDIAFSAGPKRELAWAVPATDAKLRDALDAFIARARRDGTIRDLLDRYFTPARSLGRPDAGALHDKIESTLPKLRRDFEAAQDATGLDWRLLAAIAYQESQWDADATSETGARGIMQMTEDTAKQLGLDDRSDAATSIAAAARYLRMLRDKLPARITEPDRTFMMLAAFNIGLGHLEDARVLAQKMKGNPDRWSDVRRALPLLADPQYFSTAKLGYARGGMPVAFVQRVRAYYDILTRTFPSYVPRLRMIATEPQASP
jgi:membrane-bound lytic murein transglycosylase F